MKTECPYCHAMYEVEDGFVGYNVECTACGQTFAAQAVPDANSQYGIADASVVDPSMVNPQGGTDATYAQTGTSQVPFVATVKHSKRKISVNLSKGFGKRFRIAFIVLGLLGACLAYYYWVPNVWRAKNNFSSIMKNSIIASLDVRDSSAIDSIVDSMTECVYYSARQKHMENYWTEICCNSSFIDLIKQNIEIQICEGDWSLRKLTKDYGDFSNFKDAKEDYEKRRNELILKRKKVEHQCDIFVDDVNVLFGSKKAKETLIECKKQILNNYFARHRYLKHLEDTDDLDDDKLRLKGMEELASILYIYSEPSYNINNPSELRKLCRSTAENMIMTLEQEWDKDVLFDFLRFIRSDAFQKALSDSKVSGSLFEEMLDDYMPNLANWRIENIGYKSDFASSYRTYVRK